MGHKLSYTTGLLYARSSCMQCGMSLDSWALGCPGSGNILFQRRMSSFLKEPTASPRGDHELQPQSLARSSPNSLLSLKYVA